MNSPRLKRLALCASATILISGSIAGAAHAGTVPADVRVITDSGRSLVDVRQYTDTTSVPTSPQAKCFGGAGGSGKPMSVFGATAIGIVADAAASVPELNPLLITDQFSAIGPGVCGIGGVQPRDITTYWELRVDHKYADTGGATQIAKGDDVLWTLAPALFDPNPPYNAITQPELSLTIPARTKPGVPVTATVLEYTGLGVLRPAAGASVTGAAAPTDPEGHTQVTLGSGAVVTATRAGAIPSRTLPVCVKSNLKKCPSKRGIPIFGSDLPDVIGGTLGNDTIKARAGNDKISVRGRGRDKVNCGPGFDRVKADDADKIAGNCEKVERPKGGKGK